jgi:hydroxymethylpyrimidine pyrophosphatase-like HAD family hydrolase
MECPLAPTHAANFLAAGYHMVVEEMGAEGAADWLRSMKQKIVEHQQAINDRVNHYYATTPSSRIKVPERYWGKSHIPERNPEAYSPAYTPEEQGLPSLKSELIRIGLAESDEDPTISGYLFDVDGPISDPEHREVKEEEIIDAIISKLLSGNPVGLNSGRPLDWIDTTVIQPIKEKILADGIDPDVLKKLVVIAEKGGTWMSFDQDGNSLDQKSPELEVPEELEAALERIVGEHDNLITLAKKSTMTSFEMIPGSNKTNFEAKRAYISEQVSKALKDLGLEEQFAIDQTAIAIDIENPNVGKDLGAIRYLRFLEERGLNPHKIYTYGDSASDLDMAEELEARGRHVEFIYVGEGDPPEPHGDFKVVKPSSKHASGSLEHLKSIKGDE